MCPRVDIPVPAAQCPAGIRGLGSVCPQSPALFGQRAYLWHCVQWQRLGIFIQWLKKNKQKNGYRGNPLSQTISGPTPLIRCTAWGALPVHAAPCRARSSLVSPQQVKCPATALGSGLSEGLWTGQDVPQSKVQHPCNPGPCDWQIT